MNVLTGRSIIADESSLHGSDEQFQAINPVTCAALSPCYHSATREQVDLAVSLAQSAAPRYRLLSAKRRASFLDAIAQRIDSIVDELVDRACQETGLTETRIRAEVARTTGQLNMFARMVEEGSWVNARIDTAQPDRQPLPRPDIRSLFRPLGPVAVFGASNFPIAFSVAGGDTASALAAGCPVIVKAHPYHPGVSELVGREVMAASRSEKMPEGIFALLFDKGHEVGRRLVQHPMVKAVGFTGSHRGGRSLFNLAADRAEPIPVFAEMSSINPVFLLPAALKCRGPQIAQGIHQSFTMGAGQFCTKPGVVLTDGNISFRNELIRLSSQTPPGWLLHQKIHDGFNESVHTMRRATTVTTLVSSTRSEESPNSVTPVVFETDAMSVINNPSLLDEVFGPATMLVQYRNREEILAVARSLRGQLTASIHAEDAELSEIHELVQILEERAGRLVFNQFPTGVEVGHAVVHGGPYPATTDSRFTSVGAAAIYRFVRPVCYQNFPNSALPKELRFENRLNIRRQVDGQAENCTPDAARLRRQ